MSIKLFELFAGIGAIRKAFINSQIPFECVGISEIDKFAIQSYNALYGETKNYGDISKIDSSILPDFNFLSFGFPCQDISIAGKQAGLTEDSDTRSSLLWQAMRLIKGRRPKFLLMENVKNLIGPTHKANFQLYLKQLENLGYHTVWAVLNANHFEIPQNRERVICFSILNEYPNDLPKGNLTNLTIRDIITLEVDPKYYMDKPYIAGNYEKNKNTGLWQAGNLDFKANDAIKRVYHLDGCCPTLTTMQGGHREPKILTDTGLVRKLTPLECWKLMGFTETDFNKVSFESNAQLYKQIGNSICVNMLTAVLLSQKDLLK